MSANPAEAYGAALGAVAGAVTDMVESMRSAFARSFEEAREANRRAAAERAEYLASERGQLDTLAKKHRCDPLAHAEAVGRFFEDRAHAELDELAERINLHVRERTERENAVTRDPRRDVQRDALSDAFEWERSQRR